MYNGFMKRELAIQILQDHQTEIHSFGVKSLALFGSVARSEARSDSDVDILVEFDRPVGLFGLIALQQHLEELLGRPVDVGTLECLKESIRAEVLEECIYVS
jgi:predicted nucleotidyltransferase